MKYLPNCLTLANLISGLMSIYCTMNGQLDLAAVFIFLGASFDSVDGRAARRVGNSSEFGKELDSLADMVTFGTAPMVMLLTTEGNKTMKLIAAMIFLACAAIRLARFNSEQSSLNVFIGIPVPAAALLSLLAFFMINRVIVYYILVIGLGFLMISSIRLPNFKNHPEQKES